VISDTVTSMFLVDRTIGRAFGTLCHLSSVCLWRFVLWQNGTS